MRGKSRCEDCQFFDYDEETDSNYCTQDLDEDEMERFLRTRQRRFCANIFFFSSFI